MKRSIERYRWANRTAAGFVAVLATSAILAGPPVRRPSYTPAGRPQ